MGLREALAAASTRIEQKLTARGITKLRDDSEWVAARLSEAYDGFFAKMAESVINSGLPGQNPAMPRLFLGLSLKGGLPWKPLSAKWMKQKERFGPDTGAALNFYIGLTDGFTMPRSNIPGRRGPGMFGRKPPKGISLLKYIQGLGSQRGKVESIFGAPTFKYTLKRGNEPEYVIAPSQSIPGAIQSIQARNPKSGRFEFLAGIRQGTVITAQVTAFPKLTGMGVSDLNFPEYEIVDMLAKATGDWKQWTKINHQKRIRPVVSPLIKWYLRVEFAKILKEIKS